MSKETNNVKAIDVNQETDTTTHKEVIMENTNITDEPQHEEHLHMALLGDSVSLRSVYLRVSDDKGEFFGYTEMDEEMVQLKEECKRLHKSGSIDEIKGFMQGLVNQSSQYHRRLNFATNMSNGILVKHQIRLGEIYIQQKRLLKKIDAGKNWLDYYKEQYGTKSLRSAQDFMKLASTPGIIRYAVFGRDRLLEILRAISPIGDSSDPVGEFLAKHGFIFDPEADDLLDDWRANIDTAIAMEKIKKIELKHDIKLELEMEQIKPLIENNISVDSGLISNMIIIKDSGGSIDEYLEKTVLGKGSKPVLVEREEKRKTVQTLSVMLKEIVDFYSKDTEAFSQVSKDHVKSLQESVETLTALLDA